MKLKEMLVISVPAKVCDSGGLSITPFVEHNPFQMMVLKNV